jgi:hypothetical protein
LNVLSPRAGRNAIAREQQQVQQLQQEQQQQLQSQLQALQASGTELDEALGPLRCPACGKLRATYSQLHLHMVQRHKQPAPPLFKLLPEGALQALSAAATGAVRSEVAGTGAAAAAGTAAEAAGGAGGLQQDGADLSSSSSNSSRSWGLPTAFDARAGTSSSSSSGLRPAWSPFDASSVQNSSTRTLGRVNRYYNSQGALFAPPDGHQISLKYVLLREGVDVRLVQNQARAVDVSLAHGVTQLLQRLLLRGAESAQRYEDVIVVVSDQMTHAAALERCRRAGMGVVAVCRKVWQYKGADVTLRWQWVVSGRYDV